MALNIKQATVREKVAKDLLSIEGWTDLPMRAGTPEGRRVDGYVRQNDGVWFQNFWKQNINRNEGTELSDQIKGVTGFSRSKGSLKDMAKTYNDYKFYSEELNLYCNYAPLINLETYGIKESCFLVINSEIETENVLSNFLHLIPFIKGQDTYYEDKDVIGSIFENVVRLTPKTEDYKLFRFKLAYKV
jgi:hypothetical protein